MKWNVLEQKTDNIISSLLKNRGILSSHEIENFLNPTHPSSFKNEEIGINKVDLKKAKLLVKSKIKKGNPIVVYGDYDADGICSTAILWETLHHLGANVMPFIPLREKEGYGLSVDGINSILEDDKYHFKNPKEALIISVDSGIVAHEAVAFAQTQGIDVLILDHHEKEKTIPKATAILHTQSLCAAGISYIFCKDLLAPDSSSLATLLELAAIATVTDLMPLLGPNRSIVKHGLELLNKTNRPGLRALFSVAGMDKIGTYEIGFMIGPRLNASGRIENALLALRLLCATDFNKALEYARKLNETNKQRQEMMETQTLHAIRNSEINIRTSKEKIIVIEHESYHQGIIGLIAGKLVEKYYLPSIVISKGEEVSKASARSISGFNIIEAIRTSSTLLLGAGGHPMAAGFSIATTRIEEFKSAISKVASEQITDELLQKVLRIDCDLKFSQIDMDFYQKLRQFAPFGFGNPEPVFVTYDVSIHQMQTVGQGGKHLKLKVQQNHDVFDAIAFNFGEMASKLKIDDHINIAYTVDLNKFNGHENLQLKIKDILLE